MIAWLASAALAAQVEGTWRLEMHVRSVAEVPVVKRAASTTVSVAVVRLRDGIHEQEVCSVVLRDANPLARTQLDPGVVATLPLTRAPVDLSEGYRVDLGESHLGYDATLGALPLHPDDPAVIDAGGDGRPGATVWVTVLGVGRFGVDVAQRSRAVLDGAFAGDVIRGSVRTLDFAQTVLDADAAWLRAAPVVVHDDDASWFVMTRLPVGSTCADV